MSFSLYQATVPSFLQIIGSVRGLVDKAVAHCEEKGLAHADLIQARLYPDMLPFTYQVKSCAEHSIGAIEALRVGVVAPSLEVPPETFDGLYDKLDGARDRLQALDPEELNGFMGQDMRFEFKGTRLDFTAESFLLSYAQPNFYFHATTAYDVLRNQGVKIGKFDFLGRVAVKG